MTLDDLDREIDQSLSVEPSPELLRRVRARIAEEPARRTGWVTVGVLAAGAVLAAALIGVRLLGGGPAVDAPAAPISAPLASAAIAAPAAAAPSVPSASIERAATRKAERVRAADTQDGPEVLVPIAERESLQRLLRAASREPLRLSDADETVLRKSSGPIAGVIVPPIRIELLVSQTGDEGETR